MSDLGRRIYAARKALNLTLEVVGDYVGVGKSTVRKWENGLIKNMRQDKIKKLSEVLQVSPEYLMGWTDDPSDNKTDNNANNAWLGEKIAYWRKERGLTQSKLAEKSYISRSYLAGVEIGKYNPSLDTLLDIASALNVKLSSLLGEEAATKSDDGPSPEDMELLKTFHEADEQKKAAIKILLGL